MSVSSPTLALLLVGFFLVFKSKGGFSWDSCARGGVGGVRRSTRGQLDGGLDVPLC